MWRLAFLLMVSVASQPSASADLNVYCSNLESQCRAIANAFERSSGLKVAMLRKSTGEFLAQIRAEAGNPHGDVWWGGTIESHLQAGAEGLLQSYRSPNIENLHNYFQRAAKRSGYRTVGIYVGALGIGLNIELLKQHNLPRPACWSDLTNPRYRGEIQLPDPRSSGTAYLFLTSTLARLGEEQGWDYIRRLNLNVNQYTKSGDAPVKALALGETAIAVAFLHGMTTKAVENAPVETVLPCEGAGFETIGLSMIAGASNEVAARKFIDFALSAEGQSLNAELGITAAPTNPRATTAPNTPNLEQIGIRDDLVELVTSAAERQRNLQRFEKETAK